MPVSLSTRALPKGHNTMTNQPFKHLQVGTTFRFASELNGPWRNWIKLSPRKYAPEEDRSVEHHVKSINASTVPVWGKNKFPAPLPLTGAPCHCRKGVHRDNCPDCEGTGKRIDWRAYHAAKKG